jgi:sugar fermentation stimulation protein A
MSVSFPFAVEPAEYLERPNRFRILARLHATGEFVAAHCPNPGRLRELLIPHCGVTVYLSRAGDGAALRKTACTLRLVAHPEAGTLISLDTALPNTLVWAALQARGLPPFAALTDLRREVNLPAAPGADHRSRCDFSGREADGRRCWIEVKSVSLVEDGVALFPDAVTARGRRHLLELARRARLGERAAVIFVVQRPDAVRVMAHRGADPAFAAALEQVAAAGVECHAWTTAVTLTGAVLVQPIPVLL